MQSMNELEVWWRHKHNYKPMNIKLHSNFFILYYSKDISNPKKVIT